MSDQERCILHADLDAFYAAVEQRDDPSLRGKPLIIGGLGSRGVVSTCSYEARAFGVRSAMPIVRARALAPPDAIYLPPDMKRYAASSKHVFEIFRSYTPLVEGLSLDEAFLDVGGSRRLFGDGPEIARDLRRRVKEEVGLNISVGVASTKYVAKVASDLQKPDALVIVEPGREREFLAPLGIERLWGAGPRTQERLQRAGLRTIGQVAKVPETELALIIGEHAAGHFSRLARGFDGRAVSPRREAKSISRETTFGEDVFDQDKLEHVLGELALNVGRRLRKAELEARTLRLKFRLTDFDTFTRQIHLDQPSAEDALLRRSARELLSRLFEEGMAVRLVGFGAADLVPAGSARQLDLFGAEYPERSGRLQETLDRIRDRFGDGSIRPGDAGS